MIFGYASRLYSDDHVSLYDNIDILLSKENPPDNIKKLWNIDNLPH